MPLKKPNKIPKIPKTRKKKTEAALAAIPAPKPDKVEYRCKAAFKYDSVEQKQLSAFIIETAVEFTSFVYEISVEVVKEKREILILLLGLKSQTNLAPRVQPARTEVFFEDLIGEYKIKIVKQDGCINEANMYFDKFNKNIKLLETYIPEKENNRRFCEFLVAVEEFEFSDK